LAGAADRVPQGNDDGFVDVEEVPRFAKEEVLWRAADRQRRWCTNRMGPKPSQG
jgi:hypothetical protein